MASNTTTTLWPYYTMNNITTTATTTTAVNDDTKITVGVALSVTGNILISVAMNIKKYSHNRLPSGTSYLRSPIWWVGMILLVVGEMGNFAAYGYAPASLVAPLGTTAVISNAIIAIVCLKEKFRKRNGIGIVFAVIGAILLVRFSNQKESIVTAHEILRNVRTLTFVVYIVMETIAFLFIMFLHKRLKYVKVVTILLQVALLGSLTVISAKAVSSMITMSIRGDNQLLHPVFYIMVFILVASAVGQIKFLNQAMASFDATVVMPINFVFFTLSAILSGIAFYQEFYGLTTLQVSMFLLGAVFSFGGVWCITSARNAAAEEEGAEDNEKFYLIQSVRLPNPLLQTEFSPFPHDVRPNDISLSYPPSTSVLAPPPTPLQDP